VRELRVLTLALTGVLLTGTERLAATPILFFLNQPEWYVFPFGKPRPCDPTKPVTTLKTAWRNLREKAKVTGRWHDNRHTLVTELAESVASGSLLRTRL
jgi:hypothetical protein